NHVRAARRLLRAYRLLCPLLDERLHLRSGAIPHGQIKARLQYALGDVRAHVTQANKCDVHDGPPSQRIIGHFIPLCEAPRHSQSSDHLTGRLLAARVTTLISASGPKQTWANALHMSAFGGKADMEISLPNVRTLTLLLLFGCNR